ncbi:hypothetical protein F8S13_07720 [Chloroflexia bacterium SDU3-3]|nr:hypothetical protein F8S13_07720 [Chloroflexia bacterium SDU3-3]
MKLPHSSPILLSLALISSPLLQHAPPVAGLPARVAPPQAANSVAFAPIVAEAADSGVMAYTADEGTRVAALKVRLDTAAAQLVTVNYATSDGSASQGSDYTTTSGTLTFYPGEQEKTLGVPLADDPSAEPAEGFHMALSSPSGASLGALATADVTIRASDTLGFALPTTQAYEANGRAIIPVQLQGSSTAAVTVSYTTSDGSALAGSDYTATSGTLTFAPGETWQEIPVPVTVDSTSELTETFLVTLSSPTNATLAGDLTQTVALIDDRLAFQSARWDELAGDGDSAADAGEQVAVAVAVSNLAPAATQPFTSSLRLIGGDATLEVATASYGAIAGKGAAYAAAPFTLTVGPTAQAGDLIVLEQALFTPGQTTRFPLRVPVGVARLGPVETYSGTFPTPPWPITHGAGVSDTLDIILYPPGITTSRMVGDLNVRVAATHRDTSQLRMQLTAGTVAATLFDVGDAKGANLDSVTFDDSAPATMASSPAPMAGSYQPRTPLAVFQSLRVNNLSYATLSIKDQNPAANQGVLTNWDVDIRPVVPSCAPAGSNICISWDLPYTTVTEGDASVVVNMRLNVPAPHTLTVSSSTLDSVAFKGKDFTGRQAQVTFAPGEMNKSFQVKITNDTLSEPPESFHIGFLSLDRVEVDRMMTQVIIFDNNDSPPTLSFIPTNGFNENDSSQRQGLLLSALSGYPLRVDYRLESGTAVVGSDFAPTSGTLVFQPYQQSASVPLPIFDDALPEPDEKLSIILSNPVYFSAGGQQSKSVTILANDTLAFSSSSHSVYESGSASLSVGLSATSAQTVTVDISTEGGGTATPGSDYTPASGTLVFAPGETSKTFNFPILDDAIAEANETILVRLSNANNAGVPLAGVFATVNILENDSITFPAPSKSATERSTNVSITVQLNSYSSIPVTVQYATVGGSATPGSDYTPTSGTLTISPGATSRTISVPILEDSLAEPDETINIALSNPTGAMLGTTSVATITIPANDLITLSGAAGDELGTLPVVTVRLKATSFQAVTVNYATSDGTATAGSDYTPTSGTLTIPAGSSSQSFTIPILDDTLTEPEETIIVTLSSPTNAELDSTSSIGVPIRASD